MFTRILGHVVLSVICSAIVVGQQTPSSAPSNSKPDLGREFPVILESNVAAGKTPVGTKIQARLCVATLVNGTVIPKNAVFNGEVIDSAAKTAAEPSQLAIRMDSAQWKNGSAAIKAYLTAWYYPTTTESVQNLQYGPQEPASRSWNGQGAYPSNAPGYKPFPGSDDKADKNSVPDTAASKTEDHRVLIKDTQLMRADDGTLVLVSKRSNIKLDKLTTYVLAGAGDLPPTK